MAKLINLEGERFGKLTVIRRAPKRSYLLTICDCGRHKEVFIGNLRSGKSRSCGCSLRKHGQHLSPEFAAWREIKYRCTNKNARPYKHYGGRGISVCQSWAQSFESFFNDMGKRPSPHHSLDRIDNNGNYESGNCRWATRQEQTNNRRKTVRLEFAGIIIPMSIWAKILGIKYSTLAEGIRSGKSLTYYTKKYLYA